MFSSSLVPCSLLQFIVLTLSQRAMLPFLFSTLIFTLSFSLSLSDRQSDTLALLAFKASSSSSNRPNSSLASWAKSDPCSGTWLGVTCDTKTRRVTKLVLENLDLTGSIEPLTKLSYLSVLSLKHNLLSSSINLSSWNHLNHLYLSHNNFTGTVPAGICRLRHLRRIDLSFNHLSGNIPVAELTRLPGLLTLRLESNSLTGFDDSSDVASNPLTDFNVSNNKLAGKVPLFLSKFGAAAFSGNEQLCGKPLQNDCPKPTAVNPPLPSDKHHGSINHAVMISVGAALVFLVLAGAVTSWRRTKRSEPVVGSANGYDYVKRHNGSSRGSRSGGGAVGGPRESEDMVVLEGCNNPCVGKVGDLLKASAEIMGKGSVGSTYKILTKNGSDDVAVVVKRVKKERRGGVHGKEVDVWLRLIGETRHANIVSLRAYHNSAYELLFVYGFLRNGSLNSLLHGNRGPGRTPLDWATRLRLASDSARGLAFLHDRDKAKLNQHGHLSSSNILVDHNGNACLADIGLHQLLPGLNSSYNPYKAPELIMPSSFSPNKYTCKCDVYSFGVVLMEILTGRIAGEEGEAGLVEWVNTALKREWSTWEVFDFELFSDKEKQDDMWALFQVGMLCLAALPKDRPTMSVVYKMIEDIRKDGTKSILDDISFDSSSTSQSNP